MKSYRKGNFFYWVGHDEVTSLYRVRWCEAEKLFYPEIKEKRLFRKAIFRQLGEGLITETEAWLFISEYDTEELDND